jgi:hypothetical protein
MVLCTSVNDCFAIDARENDSSGGINKPFQEGLVHCSSAANLQSLAASGVDDDEQQPEKKSSFVADLQLGTVVIRGRPYTVQDCFLEAVRADSRASGAWLNLALCLNKNSSNSGAKVVNVAGKDYDAEACFVQSAVADARNAAAWQQLYLLLADGKAKTNVSVRGKSCSATDCAVRWVEESGGETLAAWQALRRCLGVAGAPSVAVRGHGLIIDGAACDSVIAKLAKKATS